VDLFWYDGGMKPRLPEVVEAHNVEMAREGILFVGDDGAMLADFRGQNPLRFAKGQRSPVRLEQVTSDPNRTASEPARRQGGWIEAVKGGEPSPGSFLNAGSITDAVNLGTVALRAGRKIVFDNETMKITNALEANRYLTRRVPPGLGTVESAVAFKFTSSHGTVIVTGPNSPDGMSWVSLVSLRMLVRVRRCSGGKASSPMIRFGQKLTTSISSWLVPDLTAPLMSARNGGDQTMPQDRPLTLTSASSRTSPRSSQRRWPRRESSNRRAVRTSFGRPLCPNRT
jgi:hypothetical protein